MDQTGARVEDLRRPAETHALRLVFQALLEKVEHLNTGARLLPRRVRSRGLRVETSVIVGLSGRLETRLRHADPLATRVKLTKGDAVGSVLWGLRYLVIGRTKTIRGSRRACRRPGAAGGEHGDAARRCAGRS